ncbi:MAG TPA: hypothetical protein DDY13_07155 [Cytophagales bacterium]|jgi:polyhydroxyalkanoate synthesis regulator phasin|nr:hypothetical protein [Cytophagales bacterium]
MEDVLKKILYTSVGMISLTAEKVQQLIQKLVDEDKISEEEGRKIVDDIMKNANTKKEEFESQLKSITERVVSSFDFASKKEIAELRRKIDALETKLNKEAVKSSANKSATKKDDTKKA